MKTLRPTHRYLGIFLASLWPALWAFPGTPRDRAPQTPGAEADQTAAADPEAEAFPPAEPLPEAPLPLSPLSRPRAVTDITIRARLDPAERGLQGEMSLVWRNRTGTATDRIPLHLYLNAFRNNRSTFMKEGGASHRRRAMEEDEWGWIEIRSLRVDGGPEMVDRLRFIHPDDDNAEDRTLAEVPLDDPVPPGGEAALEIAWQARLPHAFARTGFKGNFFMVAQWFPKPAVFGGSTGWNAHQFHSLSEFFADYGRYDVTLTLPADYVVGATGRRVGDPVSHPDGTLSHRFVQEDVHDFAWTADPDFVAEIRAYDPEAHRDPDWESDVAARLGLDPADLRQPPVEVTLLLQPEHAGDADRVFRAAFAAIRRLAAWYGPYPYDTLTIVDPQHGARGAGGMEYPTLIAIGSAWPAPSDRLSPEGVTVHEYAHQYWYGLVASNEFEESWLDEGLTTFTTGLVLDEEYGPARRGDDLAGLAAPWRRLIRLPSPGREDPATLRRPDPLALHLPPAPWSLKGGRLQDWLLLHRLGLPAASLLADLRDVPFATGTRPLVVPAVEGYRRSYLEGPRRDRVVRPAWMYMDAGSYSLNSYRRPALVLTTLQRAVGEAALARGLRLYHQRFRFRHPTTADLEAALSESAGQDLTWLLDPLLHGTGALDYAVSEVAVTEIPGARGVFGSGPDLVVRGGARSPGQPPAEPSPGADEAAGAEGADTDPDAGTRYRSEVLVRRLGEVAVPVTVEIEFEDGSRQRETWDGAYTWTRLVFEEGRRVRRATVDPDRVYAIDLDWSNNTRLAEPDRRPTARWSLQLLLWMQNVLAFYGGLS